MCHNYEHTIINHQCSFTATMDTPEYSMLIINYLTIASNVNFHLILMTSRINTGRKSYIGDADWLHFLVLINTRILEVVLYPETALETDLGKG